MRPIWKYGERFISKVEDGLNLPSRATPLSYHCRQQPQTGSHQPHGHCGNQGRVDWSQVLLEEGACELHADRLEVSGVHGAGGRLLEAVVARGRVE